MKQERAIRTRNALVQAAADCFGRCGYERTSLAAVSEFAGVTKGALSFHFSSKEELAGAVQDRSRTMLRAVAESCADKAGRPALQGVVDLSHLLAGLFANETVVCAGMRLSRERGTACLHDTWRPTLQMLLDRARSDRSLRDGSDVLAVEMIVRNLMAHAELAARQPGGCRTKRECVTRIWRLILPEISAPDALQHINPAGATD